MHWNWENDSPEGGGRVKEEKSRNETKAFEDQKPVVGSSGEDGRGSKTRMVMETGKGELGGESCVGKPQGMIIEGLP